MYCRLRACPRMQILTGRAWGNRLVHVSALMDNIYALTRWSWPQMIVHAGSLTHSTPFIIANCVDSSEPGIRNALCPRKRHCVVWQCLPWTAIAWVTVLEEGSAAYRKLSFALQHLEGRSSCFSPSVGVGVTRRRSGTCCRRCNITPIHESICHGFRESFGIICIQRYPKNHGNWFLSCTRRNPHGKAENKHSNQKRHSNRIVVNTQMFHSCSILSTSLQPILDLIPSKLLTGWKNINISRQRLSHQCKQKICRFLQRTC